MSPYHSKDYLKLVNAVSTIKDPLKSKRSKATASNCIDQAIGDAFRKHAHGMEIPMMMIPKIYQAGRTALIEGMNLDEVMQKTLEESRLQR